MDYWKNLNQYDFDNITGVYLYGNHIQDNALSDPKSYIDTILNVHRKYYKIVQEAFDNDSGFATALDRAATKFVNK